jgi:hypothetical protein
MAGSPSKGDPCHIYLSRSCELSPITKLLLSDQGLAAPSPPAEWRECCYLEEADSEQAALNKLML